MPIYAYKCSACGHAKDVLQKLSDPLLDTCPACGAKAFTKQLTSAGFQLKGSGWYVTDFRDGGKKPEGAAASAPASGSAPSGDATPAAAAASAAPAAASSPSAAAAAASSTPSPAPASPAP